MVIASPLAFAPAENALDRAAHLRGETGRLKKFLLNQNSCVLPLWRGKPLLHLKTREPVFLPANHPVFSMASDLEVFLGLEGEDPRFARDISAWEPEDDNFIKGFQDTSEQFHPDLDADCAFADLRVNMTSLSPIDGEIASTAKAILDWHRSHGFCAICGCATAQAQAGWRRDCPSCNGQHFPRTDPVVIMLITKGNSVLLGRSPGWPDTMYSLLAGFAEPGETIENAVRREVAEETGIKVGKVGYLTSQPWPFPASLMIGCWGEALSDTISIDPDEIEDAIWISREEMMSALGDENAKVKPARKGSIARYLIENWLADRT